MICWINKRLPDNLECHPCCQHFSTVDQMTVSGSFALIEDFVMWVPMPIHSEPSEMGKKISCDIISMRKIENQNRINPLQNITANEMNRNGNFAIAYVPTKLWWKKSMREAKTKDLNHSWLNGSFQSIYSEGQCWNSNSFVGTTNEIKPDQIFTVTHCRHELYTYEFKVPTWVQWYTRAKMRANNISCDCWYWRLIICMHVFFSLWMVYAIFTVVFFHRLFSLPFVNRCFRQFAVYVKCC